MKVIFMGTPDFSVPVLNELLADERVDVAAVVTQPDRPKGRKRKLTPPPVKVLALENGLPVLQPEKVRDPQSVADILSYRPDLLITAAYGQILPRTLLAGPPLGCINVHASLLPEYRGAAPIQQAIIDGRTETGVTIMYMVEKLDAGDILSQVSVPIDDHDTFGTLHDKLSAAGAGLLMKTLPGLAAGECRPVPQDDDKATYAPSIRREDEAINWRKTAGEVRNLIRGLNPFPGAFTKLDGKELKIFAAEPAKVSAGKAMPGTIVKIEEDGFLVAAGSSTALKVTECQPSGKKRMSASAFLRGRTLPTGAVLGEPL
ncbi:methionyl-tRNA formyltransferase [Sporolactobacillus sp. THM7-7]|nr:methionyl-tRNA formyltransferase [Sporolactobacillus sp. THM7-7]